MTEWRHMASYNLVNIVSVNTLRPRQNGHYFPDDMFKGIFLNENVSILITISVKFVPRCPINNIPALVQIIAWRRPGDEPLSEPIMVSLLSHICVTRPQRFKQPNVTFWRETRIQGFKSIYVAKRYMYLDSTPSILISMRPNPITCHMQCWLSLKALENG